MNCLLFIFVIGACLTYDTTAVPTSDVTEPKTNKNHQELLKILGKKLSLCEQCFLVIFGLTFTLPNEIPYERLQYYTMTADQIKESCLQGDDPLLSDFCTLVDGKELDFVKEMLDCTGLKFKEDNVQPNCTVSGSNGELGVREDSELKVCESFVENCKFDQVIRPSGVSEV
ncbi:hypothetical protein DdX_16813 [Ditylenchus destructor]|uniref:Saposin B-type domain-containing protein n=1 Tax=Ditylenchus destructor TaxID=166010 RepID=A0AAD4QTT7_9BILA|nr:hypothetical protein DdX_16813 [Ditylenchus destructor]